MIPLQTRKFMQKFNLFCNNPSIMRGWTRAPSPRSNDDSESRTQKFPNVIYYRINCISELWKSRMVYCRFLNKIFHLGTAGEKSRWLFDHFRIPLDRIRGTGLCPSAHFIFRYVRIEFAPLGQYRKSVYFFDRHHTSPRGKFVWSGAISSLNAINHYLVE